MDTTGLPGGDLIAAGLRDLADGRETAAALLILIGAPRLRRVGLTIPDVPAGSPVQRDSAPEHQLYRLLARAGDDAAHARYNALIRTLVSFERAAECAS